MTSPAEYLFYGGTCSNGFEASDEASVVAAIVPVEENKTQPSDIIINHQLYEMCWE